MTYIYLFETPDYIYCGQHRCDNNKDPLKDTYKGSGKKWTNYLKENDFWYIKDFRKNVKKTILEIVMDDENRQVIGNVEKYWIEWSRETYGDKCVNISKGSGPSTKYATYEEAKEAIRLSDRMRNKTPERKAWEKRREETPERKAYISSYNKSEEAKKSARKYQASDKYKKVKKRFNENHPSYSKVSHWIIRHGYVECDKARFPSSWGECEIQEYIRRYNKHFTNIV